MFDTKHKISLTNSLLKEADGVCKKGGENGNISIAIISITIYFFYMVAYANNIFIQFPTAAIYKISLTFFLLIFLASAILLPKINNDFKLDVGFKTWLNSLVAIVVLISYSHGLNPIFEDYVRTFPTLEYENKFGWHVDTAFHASLIQSIINFGYPSIAQHGHFLTGYHALSHYVDALLIIINGVNPFESYGLFFHFKIFTLLTSILLMTLFFAREQNAFVFLVSFIISAPLIIGTWHAIGSHGLWIGSILIILSAPLIYEKIFIDEKMNINFLIVLFVVLVLISFSKISSGLMYSTFLGIFLWLRHPRNLSIYFFGLFLILFYFLYGNFITNSNDIRIDLDFSALRLVNFYNYLTDDRIERNERVANSLISGIIVTIFFLSLVLTSGVDKIKLALSGVISVFILFVITESNKSYSISDVWYFQYGLLSGVLILLVGAIIKKYSIIFNGNYTIIKKIAFAATTFVLLLILSASLSFPWGGYLKADGRTIIEKFDSYNGAPFRNINKIVDPGSEMKVWDSRDKKIEILKAIPSVSDGIRTLSISVKQILDSRGVDKSEAGLILGADYHNKLFKNFGGDSWATGLISYAYTGVQLFYGVTDMPKGYGYVAGYSKFRTFNDVGDSVYKICNENIDIKLVITVFNNNYSDHLCSIRRY